jgi:hypothetical protein
MWEGAWGEARYGRRYILLSKLNPVYTPRQVREEQMAKAVEAEERKRKAAEAKVVDAPRVAEAKKQFNKQVCCWLCVRACACGGDCACVCACVCVCAGARMRGCGVACRMPLSIFPICRRDLCGVGICSLLLHLLPLLSGARGADGKGCEG